MPTNRASVAQKQGTMAYITITPLDRPLTITAGGSRLGQTQRALALQEGSYPTVLYVPHADVDMALLTKTTHQTRCPHKGLCSYYAIQTAQGLLDNAAWSYETPIAGLEAIAGHLAFDPDKVTLA